MHGCVYIGKHMHTLKPLHEVCLKSSRANKFVQLFVVKNLFPLKYSTGLVTMKATRSF